jgi:nucleoside-diphosphate-sugar epimerase
VENAADAHLLAADALPDVCAGAVAPRTTGAADTLANESTTAEAAWPPAGRAYFISQGEPVDCWQWIDGLLALEELPPVEKSLSLEAACRIGGVCEHVYQLFGLKGEPPMTRFLAAQLARSHWFDISAARRDLGYQPRVSTADGMRRLAAWLRQTS